MNDLHHFANGTSVKMQKHRYWQGALETAWQQTCRRETAIRSLIEAGPVSHAQADVLAKDLGTAAVWSYKWSTI
jgi:hypothetical protein